VLQGERPMAKDNRTIGRFHLDGIPPAPRGIPQIEVTFDIDANGILNVTAKDKATGKSQNIRIEASSGLTEAEIKKMKSEAEANAEADRKVKEEVEKINMADSHIFKSEKDLKDYGDKLPADKKQTIETALAELKEAHKNRNVAAIDSAITNLNNAWQAVSEEMYKASQGAPDGAQQQPTGDAGNAQQDQAGGNVTDVDFEEVKEDKK
jgi:molecular chaperone DnaK